MSSISDYKSRVSGSILSNTKTITKKNITDSFFNSPSYYQVQSYSPSMPNTPSTLDSWIVDDSKIKELKQLTLIPDQVLNFGDIIIWNTEHWITLQVDFQGGIYYRGSIQRCFSSIKWLDSTGEIREAWFTYRSDTPSNFGIQDGRIMTMPNERRHLIVQSNVYTQEIRKDRRFIFDNRAWKTISIEGLVTGIITLTLEEDLENNADDRMDLRVADYTNNIPSYSLTILNGTNLSLQAGNTLTLTTELKDRGIIITNKALIFTSSNPSIATVSNMGVITTIANGSTVITVKMADDVTITDSLSLTVEFSTAINKVVVAVGSDTVLLGDTETYIREIKNNGVIDNASFVQWFLYADDGISVSDLATLSFNSTTQCTIKPNNKAQVGFVKLKCVVIGSPSVYEIKRIEIVSLF